MRLFDPLKEVSLGMNKAQLILSWGVATDVNRSGGGWGVQEQWVYREGTYGPATYIYLRDGVVTSWQDHR